MIALAIALIIIAAIDSLTGFSTPAGIMLTLILAVLGFVLILIAAWQNNFVERGYQKNERALNNLKNRK